MLNRLRQVWSALTARISPADRAFVARHLNAREERLFWDMAVPDQRHALNVAYTALSLAVVDPRVDRALLVKCALLHDVGKKRGDVSTLDKILTVLVHRLRPHWVEKIAAPGRGGRVRNIRHAFYIYRHHPARSAALVRQAGTAPAVADIISRHHEAPARGEPPELTLLREADERN